MRKIGDKDFILNYSFIVWMEGDVVESSSLGVEIDLRRRWESTGS